jgi:hypothetical protein
MEMLILYYCEGCEGDLINFYIYKKKYKKKYV